MSDAPREPRQLVRYAFYRLDPVWRRLPAAEQRQHKEEFAATIAAFAQHVLLRSYSLVGVRGDADFMLWQVAEEVDTLQALQTALNRTRLGAHLSVPYSYLAMTRRSIYEIRDAEPGHTGLVIRPSQARYLFVYPFVKTREWYALPMGERQAMMEEHMAVGRRFPSIRLNTTYSYGLDDQEFVVAFEGDDPAEFLDLVMALRESQASRYTLRDTPTFTCIQMPIADMLDALGGEAMGADAAPAPRADGLVPACALRDLPPGASRRVVARGEVVAVFNVGGRVFAIGNRCTHARASLADGTVDAATAVVTCPWHAGRFELATGRAIDGPPKAAVPVYPVRIEDGTVLLGAPGMAVAD